jgi:hypothetical protein
MKIVGLIFYYVFLLGEYRDNIFIKKIFFFIKINFFKFSGDITNKFFQGKVSTLVENMCAFKDDDIKNKFNDINKVSIFIFFGLKHQNNFMNLLGNNVDSFWEAG